jgi:hypothetical protein
MKAILFAALMFATASASGTAQRTPEDSCIRFNCTAETGVIAGRNGESQWKERPFASSPGIASASREAAGEN